MSAPYVFLDSEFVPGHSVRQAVLLSIGLCTATGDEFYVVIDAQSAPDTGDEFLRARRELPRGP